MIDFASRITLIRKKLGLNQKNFAEKLGISFRVLQDYERGVSEPRASVVRKIAHFGNVSNEWLLTGRGEMSAPVKKERGNQFQKPEPRYTSELYPKLSEVEDKLAVVDVYAYTAVTLPHLNLCKAEPVEVIGIPRDLLKPNTLAFKTFGRNMEPYIREGSIVGIEPDNDNLVEGEVYLFQISGMGLTLRRVSMESENIILKSDNSFFPSIVMPKDILGESTVVVGKVAWSFQRY